MFRRLRKQKAQTTLEYVILVSVIVAALIGMQVYVKRGFSGKLKESADSIGQQFSPGHTTSEYTVKSETESKEELLGAVTTTDITKQETTRTGNETVETLGSETVF